MEFEMDVDHISAATKQEQSFTIETSYFSVDKVITVRDRYNQRIRLLNNEDKGDQVPKEEDNVIRCREIRNPKNEP